MFEFLSPLVFMFLKYLLFHDIDLYSILYIFTEQMRASLLQFYLRISLELVLPERLPNDETLTSVWSIIRVPDYSTRSTTRCDLCCW
jgi:hypothetical protein